MRLILALLALAGGATTMSQIRADTFETGDALSTNYSSIFNCGVSVNGAIQGGFGVQTTGPSSNAGRFRYGSRDGFSGGTELTPTGRQFHASACIDFSEFTGDPDWPGGVFDLLFELGRNPPHASQYSTMFAVFRGWKSIGDDFDPTTAVLRLSDNAGHGSAVLDEYEFAVTPTTVVKVEVQGEASTITGGSEEGGGSAASDGWIRVYVNGVAVIEHLNAQVGHYIANQGPAEFHDSWANVDDLFHWVLVGVQGRLDNLCIRDDLLDCGFSCAAGESTAISDLSNPCPCDSGASDGTGAGSVGSVPDPIGPLPAPTFTCTGGAPVEEIADLAGLEECWQ